MLHAINSTYMSEQAKQHYIEKRYEQAATLYEEAVRTAYTHKQLEQVRHMLPILLHCYIELQQYAQAFAEIEQYDYLYRQLNGDRDQCYYKLYKGILYMRTGAFERAEIYFQQLFQMALGDEMPRELIKYGTYYLHLLQRSQQIDKGLAIAALIELYIEQEQNMSQEVLCSFYSDYIALIQQTNYALRSEKYIARLRVLQPTPDARLTYYEATLLFIKGQHEQAFTLFEHAFSCIEDECYTNHVFLLKQCMKRYEEVGQFQALALLQKRYILVLENTTHRHLQQQTEQTVTRMNLQEIERLANEDSLTGIYNRYYLEREAEELILMSRLVESNCSCAVFDVDYFKGINDTYGHLAGDEALKQVVEQVCQELQCYSHLFARYGGDEFVVLLNEPVIDVQRCMTRIVERICRTPIYIGDVSLHVTISIGLVHNKEAHVNTFKELFRLADDSLYCAKKSGRNQLYVHPV